VGAEVRFARGTLASGVEVLVPERPTPVVRQVVQTVEVLLFGRVLLVGVNEIMVGAETAERHTPVLIPLNSLLHRRSAPTMEGTAQSPISHVMVPGGTVSVPTGDLVRTAPLPIPVGLLSDMPQASAFLPRLAVPTEGGDPTLSTKIGQTTPEVDLTVRDLFFPTVVQPPDVITKVGEVDEILPIDVMPKVVEVDEILPIDVPKEKAPDVPSLFEPFESIESESPPESELPSPKQPPLPDEALLVEEINLVVSLSGPAGWIAGTVEYDVSVSGFVASQVDLFISDTVGVRETVTRSGPGVLSFNSTSVPDGVYTISARAKGVAAPIGKYSQVLGVFINNTQAVAESIAITPSAVEIPANGTTQFRALLKSPPLADKDVTSTATWIADKGTIVGGVYKTPFYDPDQPRADFGDTASASMTIDFYGERRVIAATASIVVKTGYIGPLYLDPQSINLGPNQLWQFHVLNAWDGKDYTDMVVEWHADGPGFIDGSGTYHSPEEVTIQPGYTGSGVTISAVLSDGQTIHAGITLVPDIYTAPEVPTPPIKA
jgi:hypothetical protein